MKYKILFFGEDEPMRLTKEQFIGVKAYIKANPKAKFIEVNEEMLNVSSIKRLAKEGQEELTQLTEPEGKPPSRELMEQIRMKSIKNRDSVTSINIPDTNA